MRTRLAVLVVVVLGCPMMSPLVVVATLVAAVVAPAVVVVTAVVEVGPAGLTFETLEAGMDAVGRGAGK